MRIERGLVERAAGEQRRREHARLHGAHPHRRGQWLSLWRRLDRGAPSDPCRAPDDLRRRRSEHSDRHLHSDVGGQPANAAWSIDQGAIGSVNTGPASATTFTPRGTTGGLATITASLNGQTATGQVFVQLTAAQNGVNPSNPGEQGQNPVDAGALSQGGGVGGVGGEGLGGAVTDGGTLGALQTPTGDAGALGLTLLYPYDKTVWPRGMLAPLLMWGTTGASAGNISADAIQIALKTTSGSFSYTGTFGPPAILAATGGPYIRSPIPQDIWTIATNTAGGTTPTGAVDQLTMSLTIAVGGVGYGPITETWNVAPGLLTGTVYYNSYGTQFVKNWVNPDSAGNPVGAAILGIHSGDLAPHLVVGQNSPLNASGFPTDDTGCRVCHVVSSKGRWVLTESEQGTPTDGLSFLYDLTNQDAGATTLTPQGTFAWAGLTSDGAYALTEHDRPVIDEPGDHEQLRGDRDELVLAVRHLARAGNPHGVGERDRGRVPVVRAGRSVRRVRERRRLAVGIQYHPANLAHQRGSHLNLVSGNVHAFDLDRLRLLTF